MTATHPETDPDSLRILRDHWREAGYPDPSDHGEQTAEARRDERLWGHNDAADWAGDSR